MYPLDLITRAAYDDAHEMMEPNAHVLDFWQEHFDKFRQYLPAGTVLDVGCGCAEMAILFKEAGYGYLGLDNSKVIIDKIKDTYRGVNAVNIDLYNPGRVLAKRSFDGLWSSLTLHHIRKASLPGVLDFLNSILKPSGVGFVSIREQVENIVDEEYVDMSAGYMFYSTHTLEGFASYLTAAKFEILEKERSAMRMRGGAVKDYLNYFIKK